MRVSFIAGVLGVIFVYNAHILQNRVNVPPKAVMPAVEHYKVKEEVKKVEEVKEIKEIKKYDEKKVKEIKPTPQKSKYAFISHLPIYKHIHHIEKRCNARGWGEQCVRDTLALSKQESVGGLKMVGDNGLSHGWYHIQTRLHNITKEQANDIVFATDWVHDRWARFGYPEYRSKALASHNCPACGYSGVGKKYADKVKLKSAFIKEKQK